MKSGVTEAFTLLELILSGSMERNLKNLKGACCLLADIGGCGKEGAWFALRCWGVVTGVTLCGSVDSVSFQPPLLSDNRKLCLGDSSAECFYITQR